MENTYIDSFNKLFGSLSTGTHTNSATNYCTPVDDRTKGEKRMRIEHQGELYTEDTIKRLCAMLIDFIDANATDDRCKSRALTAIEEASMWAVKSCTE